MNIIKTRLNLLRKSGEFSLLAQKVDISNVFKSKEIKSYASLIKTLNLTRTNFSSAVDFPEMNALTTLIADSSELKNFENFLIFPKLAKISIQKTPVASKKNFKLSLYLLFGETLSSINGRIISEEIRRKAAEYPDYARELVNNGWIAVYPPPSDEDFDKICEDYNVVKPHEITQDNIEEEEEEVQEDLEAQANDEKEYEQIKYENLIQSIRDKQEEQLQNCADYLGFEEEEVEEEENDEEFAYNVAGLFMDHGIELGMCSNEEIIETVTNLCKQALQQ